MKIDIYKIKKHDTPRSRKFLLVRAGENPPMNLNDLVYLKEITIKPDDKRIALDTNEAISNIKQNGFHIQETKLPHKD